MHLEDRDRWLCLPRPLLLLLLLLLLLRRLLSRSSLYTEGKWNSSHRSSHLEYYWK